MPPVGLLQRNFITLFLVLLSFQIITLFFSAYYVLFPVLNRTATDLAHLMLDISSHYQRLAESEREIYRKQWSQRWQLEVMDAEQTLTGKTSLLIYNYLLGKQLEYETTHEIEVLGGTIDGQFWYWVDLPQNGERVRIGFRRDRINTQPPLVMGLLLLALIGFSLLSSLLLARYLYLPMQRLLVATRSLVQGRRPAIPIEKSSRESYELSQQISAMATDIYELLSQRSTLLVGVSHELRTPLTRMRLALEINRDAIPPAYYRQVEQDIAVMEGIISQFMQLGKGVEAGEETLNSINGIIGNVITSCSNPQRVHCDAGDNPVRARVNPQALERILANFIDNALKYSDEPVVISLEQAPSAVTIRVVDKGRGFAPEHRHLLTTAFFTAGDSSGIGLGLAIARLLARTHGWDISLQARPGGGTVAAVVIPLNTG